MCRELFADHLWVDSRTQPPHPGILSGCLQEVQLYLGFPEILISTFAVHQFLLAFY